MALATKNNFHTIVSSFRDDDFARIHKYLTWEMRMTTSGYLATLDRSSDAQIADIGVQTSFTTDATFFLSRLKERLAADKHAKSLTRDANGIWPLHERVLRAHCRVSATSFRGIIRISCIASLTEIGLEHALAPYHDLPEDGRILHACKCANSRSAPRSGKFDPRKTRAHAYPTALALR